VLLDVDVTDDIAADVCVVCVEVLMCRAGKNDSFHFGDLEVEIMIRHFKISA